MRTLSVQRFDTSFGRDTLTCMHTHTDTHTQTHIGGHRFCCFSLRINQFNVPVYYNLMIVVLDESNIQVQSKK